MKFRILTSQMKGNGMRSSGIIAIPMISSCLTEFEIYSFNLVSILQPHVNTLCNTTNHYIGYAIRNYRGFNIPLHDF